MHVFTEQLEEITILANWENKYVVGFEILQELGVFLLIGTNEIDLVKSTITSNVKRTKFLSSMKFSIRKDTVLRVKEDAKLKWNKGYGYSIKDDLLYVWSLQDIHFYKLSTL